ncbi:uncharacterized protein LOC124168961 [Ischnura elegans]|uniref:uncharacterized protein LOC124168961 n=1 Tax=Ischnura elegans TaxID=197161 RepID=UPI001ED8ACA4|nr:uncharacterized protein LOC124168961 [Ischnura elegans]
MSTRSGIVVLSLFLLLLRGCLSATRHDDICGDYNGRKLYLELGHRGFLSAKDVSLDMSFRGGGGGSPSASNLTSTHRQCAMEIVTCPSCVITIVFHALNLTTCSQDGSCRCDYMWITEPPYEASGAPFCGVVNSPPSASGDIGQAEWFGAFPRGYRDNSAVGYRSRTRTVSLSLLFASHHQHAFTLEYSSERNRQFHKGYRPNPSANATTGGILSSPFFPSLYPRDLGAEHFIISPDPSARVRLLFSDFQLAASSIVEFYDWNGTRLEVSSGAQFRPPVVLSSGPSLLVRFYANGGTGLGYKATYSFLTGQIADNILKPFTDCGGFVEDIGGAITMMEMVPPGSMRAYDCVWIVRPPKFRAHLKTHLYLRVAQFQDMGGSTELHVRQGTTSETPLLEVLRLPSPSAASPMRHHGSSSTRYKRHVSHNADAPPHRNSHLFGWLQQQAIIHPNGLASPIASEIAEPVPLMGAVNRNADSTYRIIPSGEDLPVEVPLWETNQPTTGAPSSPLALMASPVTDQPRSPPPRRRRPPPPVAARKQVGREHVLPLEVGFYVTLSGTFAHESRLSIVYTAFSYMDCFAGSDFLCKNHRCIPGRLTCDGFDHCGDASDEPPSCHTDGDGGLLDGPGGIGMMGGMGSDNGLDRHWYSHTPNYYFPKMERYPDLKTATLVFIVSSLGLILLIAALIILLYRMGSRARQHRELQSRLQTISDLLGEYDGARIEEISTDDPPDYEAPPTYEDVVKAANGPPGDCASSTAVALPPEDECTITEKEQRIEGRRRARPRPASMTSATIPHDDLPGSSFQSVDIPTLFPPPPNTSSRSCQTTPIPDSPPPTYETALLRASQSMNIAKVNSRLHGSTSTPLFPISQPLGPTPSTSTHVQGFASLPSSAPNSLPYMQTLPELPERHISESISSDDGHSTFTDATLLEEGVEDESQPILMPISPVVVGGTRVEQTYAPMEGHRQVQHTASSQTIIADGNLGPAAVPINDIPSTSMPTGGNVLIGNIASQEQVIDDAKTDAAVKKKTDWNTKKKTDGAAKTKTDEGYSQNERIERNTPVPVDLAIPGCSRDADNGVRLKMKVEETAKGLKNGKKGLKEDKIKGGNKTKEVKEGGIPEVTIDSPKETTENLRTNDTATPAKDESNPDKASEVSCGSKDPEEVVPKSQAPKDVEGELGAKGKDAENDGKSLQTEEPAEKDEVATVEKVENPIAKELEECTVRVKDMVRRQESMASKGSKEDVRKEVVEGNEAKEKKNVTEEAGPSKEEAEEKVEGAEEDDGKPPSPLPDEIVGGLVKGHIKLFQGMSINKEDDDGEARMVRRRVAMRGWRSMDVGCAERSFDEC